MKKINEKLIVLLILGLLVHQYQVNCAVVTAVLTLIEFAWTAFEIINTVHDTYVKFDTPSTADLMEQSEELAQSLDKWGARLEEKIQQSVDLLLTRIPLLDQISDDIQLLNFYVGRISELYADYRSYLDDPETFDERELDNLVKIFTSRGRYNVQGTISAIFNLVAPQGLGSLRKSSFVLLAEEAREFTLDLCNTAGTPQLRLNQLYDVVIETEKRAFMMTIFGYTVEGYTKKVNRTHIMEYKRDKLIRRAKKYLVILKKMLTNTPTLFRQCDPVGGHERGVTYLEFERFMSGYVVSQQVFRSDGRCWGTCEERSSLTEIHYNGCGGVMCAQRAEACAGQLMECGTLSGEITYCLNDVSDPRRFQWFKDGNKDYGDNSNGCSGTLDTAQASHDRHRDYCKVCGCICVEGDYGSRSNHFISLREQLTNVENNMVATGFRFVMKNQILYIQIMQGKLLPHADIDVGSTSWVELEDYYFDEERSKQDSKFKFIKKTADGETHQTEDDKDVFTLTPEGKKISLDFLQVPKNHIITGVRFRRFPLHGPGQVQLEIHATAIDVDKGELDVASGRWIKPKDMLFVRRGKLQRSDYGKVQGAKIPTQSTTTKIDSKPYSSIEIDHSGFEEDGAQTTIPLLDAIPVITEPPIPIIGLGLYHKKQSGYGGFLTLVAEGFNMARFIPTDDEDTRPLIEE